jgi:hypothetical protein
MSSIEIATLPVINSSATKTSDASDSSSMERNFIAAKMGRIVLFFGPAAYLTVFHKIIFLLSFSWRLLAAFYNYYEI